MRHNLHMQLPMTQVIAVRGFHWVDDPEHQLLVSIGKPEETPDGGGEFYCPIQTNGFGDDEFVQAIFGVDGFQAIELAMRFIGYRLTDIKTPRMAGDCVGSSVTMGSYQRTGRKSNSAITSVKSS